MKKHIYILLILLGMVSSGAKAQNLAVHTNVLFDALMTPSLGLELGTSNSTTLNIDVAYALKPYGHDISLLALQPEYRYWFGRRPLNNFFVGLGGLFTNHRITWKDKKYEGQAYGIGPTFGFAFYIAPHLSLTIHSGCGVVAYYQKEHYIKDNYSDYTEEGNPKANSWGYSILPTNIGITFSYIIK